MFSYSIYLTKGSNISTTPPESESMKNPLISKETDIDFEAKTSAKSTGHMSLQSALTNVEGGRPDLQKEIQDMSVWKEKAVVFACGPSTLSANIGALSSRYNVTFETETFEF